MTILGATLLDVVIALIILISGILSWLRGFAEELVTILAWVVGLVVAFQFASFGAQFVPEMFNEITLGNAPTPPSHSTRRSPGSCCSFSRSCWCRNCTGFSPG